MDFRLGDKILRISQIPRKGLIKKLQDMSSRTIYVMANRLNEDEFKNIVKILNATRPKILRCYPEPLYLLAKYIEQSNARVHQVAAINTTGSTLLPEYRELIEKTFRCRIFDSFSCEGGAVVFECPESNAYHASDEYAVTEVVDSQGNPSKMGRLVTTDLWNYATPFIRYDTQDVVELSDQKCSCGRELLHIKRIYGRSSDILVTPGGQYLTVNNFTGLFQNLPAVDQFQILQKSPDEITVLIKVNGCYDLTVQSQVIGIMKSVIKEDLKLKIEPVDDIPLTPNGKRRFLIRDASISLNL
jgi:phenylacetate-CoA ligase